MGCTTCHDSHALPAPEKKTSYHRQQCVDCHRKKGCSLALAKRQEKQDNCVACHMPRINSTDISHTAIIDHRILRRPEPAGTHPVPRKLLPGEVPLVYFYKDLIEPDDPDVARDLGIALVGLARFRTPLAEQLGDTALPFLDSALQTGPRDSEALRSKAFILGQRGQHREALDLLDKVLARSPHHEMALEDAANHADLAGQRDRALAYCRRLLAVNPHLTRYRVLHVRLLNLQGDFEKAIAECLEVLQSNPASVQLRSLLVSCYLKSGNRTRAREEFAIIVKLNPPNKDELIRWFAGELRE